MDVQLLRQKCFDIQRLAGEVIAGLADPFASEIGVITHPIIPVSTLKPPLVNLTSVDLSPQPFPTGSKWLSLAPYVQDIYLQGRCWWLMEELAQAAGVPITILRACPLTEADGSAHRPCSEDGGGMQVDCAYPKIGDSLDVAKLKLIVDKFLSVCFPPLPPDQAWRYDEYGRDIMNESEIRVGGDVSALIGYLGNRNIQVDDSQYHRFDSSFYSHFHLQWRADS
jgi:hypothetical protein